MNSREEIHGLLAEFDSAEAVLSAARRARQAGYRDMDAYTPYPVEGLAGELGLPRTRVPFVVLIAGIVGAFAGFFMQYYTMGSDYPFIVGGKPLNSWPIYIPIAFEIMVLVASFAALFGMLFLNGLPRPHHPVFNVARFVEANSYRFFLCIEASDPQFDLERTRQLLTEFGPGEIYIVPN